MKVDLTWQYWGLPLSLAVLGGKVVIVRLGPISFSWCRWGK